MSELSPGAFGKLPDAAGSPRRIRTAADWQPALPRIGSRRIMIPFPATLRRLRCPFLAGAPEFVLAFQWVNSCRRNRGEWAARDDRGRLVLRAEFVRAVRKN